MGWQDAPLVEDTPSLNTLVAQRGKYTSDQMATFDRKRGQLLGDESQQPNADISNLAKEVNLGNSSVKDAFQESSSTPLWAKAPEAESKTPAWQSAPEVEDNTVMGALNSEKPLFAGDPTPDIYHWLKEKGQAIGADPLGAIAGGAAGLVEGAGMGLSALGHYIHKATIPNMPGLQPQDGSVATAMKAGAELGKLPFKAGGQSMVPTGPGAEAANAVLAAPLIPFQMLADKAREKGYPEVADQILGLTAAGFTILMAKGGLEKITKEVDALPTKPKVEPEVPKTTAGEVLSDLGITDEPQAAKPHIKLKSSPEQIRELTPEEATAMAVTKEEVKPLATEEATSAAESPTPEAVVGGVTKEALDEHIAPEPTPIDISKLRGQGGAVNFGSFFDTAKRAEELNKNLQLIDRTREDLKVGDTVRLMNGKTGTITDIVDGRFSITGKDFKDSVVRNSIDYKYKPAGKAAENYKKAGQLAISRKERGSISPDLIPDFAKWFRKSILRDDKGQPKVLYHGTSKDTPFKNLKPTSRGIFLVEDPKTASNYAMENDSINLKYNLKTRQYENINTASRVIPVYARLENPYHLSPEETQQYRVAPNYSKYQRELAEKVKQQGYDGIIYPDKSIVVFNADQVKSALTVDEPKKLGGVGKKGFGQSGAIDLRAIFKGADPNLEAERPRGVHMPYSKEHLTETLYKYYGQAANVGDFVDALKREGKMNSAFPSDEILPKAQQIWDRFEAGVVPEKSSFSELSRLNKREATDDRPWKLFAKETKVTQKVVGSKEPGKVITLEKMKRLPPSEDMNHLKVETFSPLHIISIGNDRIGAKVGQWAYGNLADIRNQFNIKLAELLDHGTKFFELNRKDKLNFMGEWARWDHGDLHQALVDSKLDWPTKDMLTKQGKMSDAAADAYLDVAKAYDEGYRVAGIDKPKIPGYMPHMYVGMWKAYVIHPEEGLIKVLPYSTRWQAVKAKELAEKQGLMGKVIEPQLKTKYSFVNDTQKMIQTLNNFGKLGKAAANMMVKIQDGVLEGTITESLERHGIGGFLGEMGGENGLRPENLQLNIFKTLLNKQHNNSVFKIFEKSMADFTRAGKNRTIIEAVAKPFFQNIEKFNDMPNTVEFVKGLISKATGFSTQEFRAVDLMVKKAFVRMGLSPNIPTSIIQTLNTIARTERINIFNLGFSGEHDLFALPGIMDLYRMHTERKINGEPTGGFYKSLGTFANDQIFGPLFRSEEGRQAIKWAQDNGVYKSNYYDNPSFTGKSGVAWDWFSHKSLEFVINHAKSSTFMMAYNYFKDIMPKEHALKAAANHTSKTMQSFDVLDKPELFSEGYGGMALRPFNQIKVYNAARIIQYLELVKNTAKDHPTQLHRAIAPLIGIGALYIALAGAKGIPGHDDWDILRKWANENTDMDLGSFEEFMMNIGLPDWVTFGVIPSAINMDIRGTFGTNISDFLSGAGLEFGGHALKFSYLQAKKFLTGKVDPGEVYKEGRAMLPTTLHPWVEDAAAEKLGGNIPRPSKLEPTTPRTPQEDLTFKISSKRALSESIRNEHRDLLAEIDARHAKKQQQYLRTIVGKLNGFDTGRKDVGDIINDAINAKIGFDTSNIDRMIVDEIIKSKMPAPVTYLKRAAAMENDAGKALRFNNIIRLLGEKGLGG